MERTRSCKIKTITSKCWDLVKGVAGTSKSLTRSPQKKASRTSSSSERFEMSLVVFFMPVGSKLECFCLKDRSGSEFCKISYYLSFHFLFIRTIHSFASTLIELFRSLWPIRVILDNWYFGTCLIGRYLSIGIFLDYYYSAHLVHRFSTLQLQPEAWPASIPPLKKK